MDDLETVEEREGRESVIEDLEAPAETQENVSGGMASKVSPLNPTAA